MPADFVDKILEAAHVGETTDWEFKSAKGGFPGSFFGADKIRTGWRLNRWRAPKLECHDRPSRVELVLPMVSLIPEETLLHLRAMLGVAIDSLTPSELQALATAALEKSVSNNHPNQAYTAINKGST